MKALAVGCGGFIGAISRYYLSGLAQSMFKTSTYPIGTATVNITGCLIIGALSEVAESRGVLGGTTGTFLFIGVLGGFTTFSAFGNETVSLFRDGQGLHGVINIISQVVLCLLAVWVGRVAAGAIWK